MYRRIGVLAQDTPGTMMRIVSLATRRGYELVNFSAERGRGDGLCWCRMELMEGRDRCERLILQLKRLMETVDVVSLDGAMEIEMEKRSA